MNRYDNDFGLKVLKAIPNSMANEVVDLGDRIDFLTLYSTLTSVSHTTRYEDAKEQVQILIDSLEHIAEPDKESLLELYGESNVYFDDFYRNKTITRIEYDAKLYRLKEQAKEVLGFEFEVIDSEGGGEGGAEHVEVVLLEKVTNRYYRMTGTYYSYDGYYMDNDCAMEVEPYEKTITAYRNVGSK